MSLATAEAPDRPDDIPAEEWSILAEVLPDRWPDGRPRSPWTRVGPALQVSAAVAILTTTGLYGLDQLAPAATIAIVALAMLGLGMLPAIAVSRGLIGITTVRMMKIGQPADERLPGPIARLLEQAARLLAEGRVEEADQVLREAMLEAGEYADVPCGVLAELLYARALARAMIDDAATANALLEEAELIWQEATPDSLEAAEIDFSLAILCRPLGDLPRAERLYRRSARALTSTGQPATRAAVASLLALGELREELGDAAEAETIYAQVIELLGNRPGAARKRALVAIDRLIALALGRRDFDAARRLVLRALRITHREYPEDHPFQADRLDDLGQLYLALGSPERSISAFERAEAIRKRAFGTASPFFALSRGNGAEVCAALGDHATAFEILAEVMAIEDRFIARAALGRSDRQLMAYLSMFYSNFCKFLSLLNVQDRSTLYAMASAFELVQRRKAAGIEVLAAHRRAILARRDDRLAEKLERIAELRQAIARLHRAGPGLTGLYWQQRVRLEDLHRERDDLKAEVRRTIRQAEGSREVALLGKPLSPRDVPDGAVLVEFVRFHVYRFEAVPARGEERWG
jgi:tetratricopeptide (TPR) repeat protein